MVDDILRDLIACQRELCVCVVAVLRLCYTFILVISSGLVNYIPFFYPLDICPERLVGKQIKS